MFFLFPPTLLTALFHSGFHSVWSVIFLFFLLFFALFTHSITLAGTLLVTASWGGNCKRWAPLPGPRPRVQAECSATWIWFKCSAIPSFIIDATQSLGLETI